MIKAVDLKQYNGITLVETDKFPTNEDKVMYFADFKGRIYKASEKYFRSVINYYFDRDEATGLGVAKLYRELNDKYLYSTTIDFMLSNEKLNVFANGEFPAVDYLYARYKKIQNPQMIVESGKQTYFGHVLALDEIYEDNTVSVIEFSTIKLALSKGYTHLYTSN